MQYYAIGELELKQFHMAAIVAGGSKEAVPVLAGIRGRKISYAVESQKPANNKQSTPLELDCTHHEWYQGQSIHCHKQAVSH